MTLHLTNLKPFTPLAHTARKNYVLSAVRVAFLLCAPVTLAGCGAGSDAGQGLADVIGSTINGGANGTVSDGATNGGSVTETRYGTARIAVWDAEGRSVALPYTITQGGETKYSSTSLTNAYARIGNVTVGSTTVTVNGGNLGTKSMTLYVGEGAVVDFEIRFGSGSTGTTGGSNGGTTGGATNGTEYATLLPNSYLKLTSKAGDFCGASDSKGVVAENVSSQTIDVKIGWERLDGTYDTIVIADMKPGDVNYGSWTCHGTGKYKLAIRSGSDAGKFPDF